MISLQAFHPLQVGGQAIIQALHSLLLTLDSPCALCTPGHPRSQAPGTPGTLHAGGMGHRVPGAQAPSTCIESGHTVGQPGLVAGQLQGIQGLVICGEAGEGAEAHVAQGRRQEAKTQV